MSAFFVTFPDKTCSLEQAVALALEAWRRRNPGTTARCVFVAPGVTTAHEIAGLRVVVDLHAAAAGGVGVGVEDQK